MSIFAYSLTSSPVIEFLIDMKSSIIYALLGVKALSVDDETAVPEEKVDLLFLGGALYAYGIDDRLKTYITALSPDTVGKAVLFSTSWLSKHALDVMRKALAQKGIPVSEETFWAKGKTVAAHLDEARAFAKKAAK